MDKHNFKIGDKVKLCSPKYWRQGNDIGVIVCVSYYIRVSHKRDKQGTLYLPSEIYKVITKGQQLEFAFMTP